MDHAKICKKSIIIYIILTVLLVIVSFIEINYLPEILQEYNTLQENKALTYNEVISFLLLVVLFAAYIVSLIGIYLLKYWARTMFTLAVLLGYIPYLGLPIEVHGNFTKMLMNFSHICLGIIFSLIYFSDLKENFQ